MAGAFRRNVDFTRGSIFKALLLFAVPIMLGEVFQNLYHSVDSIVLGNYAGEGALAAVSICGTLTNLLVGFCNGLSVGSTVVVSKAFGSSDEKHLGDCVRYTYSFSVLVGIGLSVIGVAIAPLLVRISNANADIFPHALTYLRIYLAGLVFSIVYNNSAGILRGMGDMHTPFIILVISSVMNIALDLLFCAVLDWGIAGVAWATVISQVVSVIISHIALSRRGYRLIAMADTLKNGMGVISQAMDVGVSAGIQGSMISFSNIFVWRYINRFPTAVVAGVGIGQRIEKFVSLPASSFGTAVTTFVGQNIGAGNRERIREGIKAAFMVSLPITMAMGLIMYPLSAPIAAIFNRNADVVSAAVAMNHVLMPLYFINSIRLIILGTLRAFNRSRMAMVCTLCGMIGVRQIFLAVSMAIRSDVMNVYIGYPVGWGSAFVFVAAYYLYSRKRMREEVGLAPLGGR